MTKQEELAYCAGVIDSDGSIHIGIARDPSGKKTTRYRPTIQVGQIQRDAVDLFASMFGGSVFKRVNQSGERASIKCVRPMYHWSVSSMKAASCIKQLLPYLRIKKKQAALALMACDFINETKSTRRLSNGRLASRGESATLRLQSMWEKMKDLNSWKDASEFVPAIISAAAKQIRMFEKDEP